MKTTGRNESFNKMSKEIRPTLPECHKCKMVITAKCFLKALDALWHHRCFKCDCCDAVLADLSDSFYFKFGKKLCYQDYMRLFGPIKECFSCCRIILASDYVIKVGNEAVFHLNCFHCYSCFKSFCVGDQFVFDKEEGRILCSNDGCVKPDISIRKRHPKEELVDF